MTTSMRMRSGFSVFDFAIASSPLSAVTRWNRCLASISMKNCRSVGESSTINIFFTAMATSSGSYRRVRAHCLQQTVLREGLGQIFIRTHHSTARAVEQPVFRGEHDRGRSREASIFLDQRAGLIPVQARHQDVHENHFGLMVGDLGECIEAVFREDDLASG